LYIYIPSALSLSSISHHFALNPTISNIRAKERKITKEYCMTDIMASDKAVVETVIVGNYVEMETEGKPNDVKTKLSKFFWHGGSAYDAWFSCASNQVIN
jgi:hypothetical protein